MSTTATMVPRSQAVGVLNTATGIRRILIAEDNDSMRQLLARAMRADGHDVVQARNGLELIQWVDQMRQAEPPTPLFDLVITDLRMPLYSGQEFLEQLHFHGVRTPVILITAFGDEHVHAEALAHGACAVFDKPLDLDELRAAVARRLY